RTGHTISKRDWSSYVCSSDLDVARCEPDVILLDIALGNENSLDFLPDLIQAAKGARVLVLTGVADPELHLRAVRLGAMGVLLKRSEERRVGKGCRSRGRRDNV